MPSEKKVSCLDNQATGICGTLVVTTAGNYHVVCNAVYFIKKFIHVSEYAFSIFRPEDRNSVVLHPRRWWPTTSTFPCTIRNPYSFSQKYLWDMAELYTLSTSTYPTWSFILSRWKLRPITSFIKQPYTNYQPTTWQFMRTNTCQPATFRYRENLIYEMYMFIHTSHFTAFLKMDEFQ